jgi:putative ABC transport system permease protein
VTREPPRWRRYLRFWGPDPARDVEDEFGFHVQERIDELVARGMEYRAAREEALRGFGDIERVKTTCRNLAWERETAMHRSDWLDAVRQDVLLALRQMRWQLSLTLAAVLTLALGIGGTTAIFSVVNSVLLRPLPYAAADRLVTVWETFRDFPQGRASVAHYYDWKEQSRVLENAAAFAARTFNITSDGDPDRVRGARVTPSFFEVQYMRPELGRYFRPDESDARVVVLSYGFWQQRFAGDRAILGRDIMLNGQQFSVIGITPAGYTLTEFDERLWAPLSFTPKDRTDYSDHGLLVVGKLKPGVTRERAQADLMRVTEDIRKRAPGDMISRGVNVQPYVDVLVGGYRTQLWVLLGAVGFVLLIACGNVASLLLARATTRSKEIAIRGALGGARARLVRQLLTESLVLALVGGAAGVLVAYCGVLFLVSMGPAGVPRLQEAGLQPTVLGFALAATLISGVLFGLAPALRATRTDLQSVLRDGGRSSRGTVRDRLRALVVVGEMAVALVLLVSAGLLVRSALLVQRVQPGFDPNGVTMFRIALAADRYQSTEALEAGFGRVLEEMRAVPGVQFAGASTRVPLWGPDMDFPVAVQGRAFAAGESPIAHVRLVGGDYFAALGIGLRQGRPITSADLATGGPPVVVINQTLARSAFGTENPIGRFLSGWTRTEKPEWREVVGVIDDVRSFGREADAPGEIYLPYTQTPGWGPFQRSMAIVVRAPEGGVTPADLRRAVARVDPTLPVFDLQTMQQVMARASSPRRFNTLLLSGLGLIGLVLAAIGIYGVIAFFVTQRAHEISVRMALGATTRNVMSLVLGKGAILAGLGVLVGAAASAAATRVLSGLLFQVDALDPATYGACAAVLGVVAIAATLIPARRAARVQPGASLMGS